MWKTDFHMAIFDAHAWRRHQMETFSALLAFVREIHRSPVNSSHKGQWRWALIFSLICAWINDGVNNREAGDLRRYRAHYDVIITSKYMNNYCCTTATQNWYTTNKLICPSKYILMQNLNIS